MIRIIVLALIVALVLYMFRHHDKVKANLTWIVGTYAVAVVLIAMFAIKNILDDSEPVSSRVMNETGSIISTKPVIDDAPIRKVDRVGPVKYTSGASSLDEFLSSTCDGLDEQNIASVKIRIETIGYADINVSKEKLAKSVWYLYRIQQKLLDTDIMPGLEINLRIFRELVAYDRYRQKKVLALPHDQTGFTLEDEKIAVSLMQQESDMTRKAVLHQAYHVLSHELYGKTFPWFPEGMAYYFENLEVTDKMLSLPENKEWVPLMTGNHSKLNVNSVALRELLTLSPRIFYDSKKELNLAAAHSFVNYMLNHDAQGFELMRRYMRLLARTKCNRPEPAAEFFDRYYPGGLEALEQQWRMNSVPDNLVIRYFFNGQS